LNKHMPRGVLLFLLSTVFAQTMTAAPRNAYAQEATDYMPGQLQQLVAPIALYPDNLLGEILMASSYPYEVAMAAQWRNDNPGLSGDYLTNAVEQMPWDPSVKSLTEFPQVLQMMNSNMDWTEKLGEAFLDDQPDLMASVQQLRHQAIASRALGSSQQMTVADQGGYITINPTDPSQVYVPYYNPGTVFSPWQYPDDAPYAFSAPEGVVYAPGGYFSYYSGIVVVNALWGWDRWDWREHHINFDPRRWSSLNNGQPPPPHNEWQFSPQHRHDVPYKNVAVRHRLENAPPVIASPYRGYQENLPVVNRDAGRTPPPAQTTRMERQPQPQTQPQIRQPEMRQPEMKQPEMRQPEQAKPQPQHAAPVAARSAPPVFESFDHGSAAKTESMRGNASAQHAPPPAPRPAPRAQPSSPPSPPAHNNPPDESPRDR
jgi:hypothetical protein